MMHASRLLVVLVCLVAGSGPSAARQSTAVLSGVVVSTDEPPTPVRRAIVTVTGGGIETNTAAVTDAEGRFVISGLPAGELRVSAAKAGYVSTEYGARRPGAPGTPIAVPAGGRVTDVRITLARGAVITGTARDSGGMPAPGVTVSAVDVRSVGRAGSYNDDKSNTVTDDRGVYRLYGLAPGDYVVAFVPYRSLQDTERRSAAEIDRLLRELEQRRSGRPVSEQVQAPGQQFIYAPIFYPGTPFASDAARVRLSVGEVRENIDVTVEPAAAADVSGVVSSLDGADVSTTRLSLTPIGPSLPVFNFASTAQPPGSGGEFTFAHVPPGRYILLARNAGVGRGGSGAGLGLGSTGPATAAWAMAEVTVRGVDVGNVTLLLRPPMSVAGRVVFDLTRLAPPEELNRIRVGLVSPGASGQVTLADGTPLAGISSPSPVTVQPDGSFRVQGVLPGAYAPVAVVPGESGALGWWLRSAMLNGQDLLDLPLELGLAGGDVTGVVLTFSDRHSDLTGRLEAASGQAATGFFVVVLPVERAYWRPGARRIRSVRPATDGRFTFANLPAGEYLIAALSDLEADDLDNPAFLEQLVPPSVRVIMRDGEVTTQNLRIGG